MTGMVAAMREGLGDREVSILAPLFPATLGGEDHSDGYKFLISGGIDYIALTKAMINNAAAPGGRFGPIYLYGFSGGAQFAERYALFHSATLSGLVLASPGSVTLLDDTVEWWPGLAGACAAIGLSPDLASLCGIPVAIVIGSEDRVAGLVARPPGSPHGSIHEGLAGNSRLERARSLYASFRNSGIEASFHEVEGVAHNLQPVTLKAAEMIAQWIDAAEEP
ncbi:putative esterase [Neorhizobium sp. 2083]|uniref:alpha/beta hydrolase n=1 Tax=Neorhizobium sp. 2083 TaxID=2817762 RepID=UPI0028632176|nr:alpha/beta hydrolase [Neorhizobium sp. 2083]MDR6817543.1 putative esterase [Neorhizobium sp. 2083]